MALAIADCSDEAGEGDQAADDWYDCNCQARLKRARTKSDHEHGGQSGREPLRGPPERRPGKPQGSQQERKSQQGGGPETRRKGALPVPCERCSQPEQQAKKEERSFVFQFSIFSRSGG